MDRKPSFWVKGLKALVWKDVAEEFRSRFALNTLLMFALTTLVVVSFAVGVYSLEPGVHAALLWIIIFFSAMSGLGRVFVKEEEAGTAQALRLSASPGLVFAGKLLFNFLLVGALVVFILPFYYLMMSPPAANAGLLAAVCLLGVFCLAGTTTILAAIVSRAGGKNSLLPILAFPILLPVLITSINATQAAMLQGGWAEVLQDIQFLFAYGVVIVTASAMLFGYVWND